MRPEPYYSYKRYMIDTYAKPLQRVPIDAGFGCPHRGPDGVGGCTFCPPDGSRAPQTIRVDTVAEQVAGGIAFARERYAATGFMAYIQSFTGTFAPHSVQRELYLGLLGMFPFDAVSIGTRPDCLPPATLDLLVELKQQLDVWVELGVQTTHDRTLRRIERGHDWACSEAAIRLLSERGIKVAVHVMLGLPGESPEDYAATADRLAALPVSGIKLHNLHVIRGTPLAKQYAQSPFPVLDEEFYADAVSDFLQRTPPHVAIMRINTDTPPAQLIAPRWQLKKGQFKKYLINAMHRTSARQGSRLDPPTG